MLRDTKRRDYLVQLSLRALNNELQRSDVVTLVGTFAAFPSVTCVDTEIVPAFVDQEWLELRRGRVAQAHHKLPGEERVVKTIVDIREVRGLTPMAVKGRHDHVTDLVDRPLYISQFFDVYHKSRVVVCSKVDSLGLECCPILGAVATVLCRIKEPHIQRAKRRAACLDTEDTV